MEHTFIIIDITCFNVLYIILTDLQDIVRKTEPVHNSCIQYHYRRWGKSKRYLNTFDTGRNADKVLLPPLNSSHYILCREAILVVAAVLHSRQTPVCKRQKIKVSNFTFKHQRILLICNV